MIIPIAIGAAALYGYYMYDKKKKETALAQTMAAPPTPAGYAPNPPAAGIQYPQAVSQSNPNSYSTQQQVIRYQAAQPMPTGKYYQPADGDLTSIVALRFDPETDASGKLLPGVAPGRFLAELGKLNGFLTSGDFNSWVKAKKPLHLPAYATDKGARQYASGAVTQQ
jgi:hypothetical protein